MSRSLTIFAAAAIIALPGLAAAQATVLSGDHVIQGNLCVGAACLASEGFSRGPLMVKGPRTALGFVDTSTTGPTRDWSIVANDYPAGFSFFGIEDVEGNGIVLRIEPDAPQNALYVSSAGRLGLGTSLPQADIHAVSTLNPTLRLEMSGTLGNPDHSWDLIGNDGTFSLAEVVGTSTMGLPFRVHTGNALYTMTMRNNFIGLGTDFPQKRLHIRVAGEATARIEDVAGTAAPRSLLELINNGRPEIVMTNSDTGGEWSFGAGTNFILKQGVAGSPSSAKTKLLEIDPAGNATLTGSLVTGGPSCAGGCDAVFDPDYDLPSVSDHAARMFALGHLPNVGPTRPGAAMNVPDKLGRILNELEHAHIYIARQDGRIDAQSAEIARLRAELASYRGLDARLRTLEAGQAKD